LPAVAKKRKPNTAGRPTLVELERRKKKVLEVATKLFVREGYAATSLVDIAKGAGVATRTVYQHFGDKPAIFEEIIYGRDTGAIVEPPALQESDTLSDALLRTGRYARDVALRKQSVDLMRLMIAERNRFPQLMKKVANATFFRFQHNVEHVLEDLARRGAIPAGDHATSARYFIDFVLGESPMHIYTGWLNAPPDDGELEDKINIFILGRFGPQVAKKASSPLRARRAPAPAVSPAEPVEVEPKKPRRRAAAPS
jgi:TetR/AcrR family transcriptional repressor of mexJK operon